MHKLKVRFYCRIISSFGFKQKSFKKIDYKFNGFYKSFNPHPATLRLKKKKNEVLGQESHS